MKIEKLENFVKTHVACHFPWVKIIAKILEMHTNYLWRNIFVFQIMREIAYQTLISKRSEKSQSFLTKLISGNILFISEDAKKIPSSWVIEQRLGPAQPVSNHATSWGWILWDKNLNQSVRGLANFAFWDKQALLLHSSWGCVCHHESWCHWS